MSVFLITYDLKANDHDYSDLYALIEKYENIRPLQSIMIIDTSEDIDTVYKKFKDTLHSKYDYLLVTEMLSLNTCRGLLLPTFTAWFESPQRSWRLPAVQ